MKKNNISENFLERRPFKNESIKWTQNEDGAVTLEIENKGFFNRLAQKFFNKPPITYVHLDNTGSFLWPLIDGEKDIIELGKEVKQKFGDEAEPLYERLAKFFQILESYNFISLK